MQMETLEGGCGFFKLPIWLEFTFILWCDAACEKMVGEWKEEINYQIGGSKQLAVMIISKPSGDMDGL